MGNRAASPRAHARTFRNLTLVVVALVAVATMAAALPAQAAAASLQSRLTSALAAHGFAGAATGVRVYDLSAGRLLYSRHAATRLVPASNEKLATTSTALGRWGAAFRFKTELYATGTLDTKGVYHGRLYLKGYGDPTLSTTWWQRHRLHLTTSNLHHFVTALKNAGVKKIVGRLVGDESYFDRVRAVACWKPGMSDYCGPLSALSLDQGIGAKGQRVSNPAMWAVSELTAMLKDAGVPVSRTPVLGTTPSSATLSYTEYSATLGRILARMDKPSDNFIAEMLAKGLGARFGTGGTTAAGVKVERAWLVKQGLGGRRLQLTDGSGLSYYDRLTPGGITKLLQRLAVRKDWKTSFGALSVAGRDGTLMDRMKHTAAAGNLHGKTGTLNVASCLSGYVISANGHRLAFSMMMNGNWVDVGAAHAAQDRIGVLLARARPAGPIVWQPEPAAAASAAQPPAAASAPGT